MSLNVIQLLLELTFTTLRKSMPFSSIRHPVVKMFDLFLPFQVPKIAVRRAFCSIPNRVIRPVGNRYYWNGVRNNWPDSNSFRAKGIQTNEVNSLVVIRRNQFFRFGDLFQKGWDFVKEFFLIDTISLRRNERRP